MRCHSRSPPLPRLPAWSVSFRGHCEKRDGAAISSPTGLRLPRRRGPRNDRNRWWSTRLGRDISADTIRRREAMPEVYVHAIEGRSKDQKRALITDITAAVVKNFGVTADAVLVEIIETSRDNKAKGGVLFSER
ncbi:MAG TPA: tautomerase family protein [Acetobacteraceae bacterium]|nr:tautomerase family protein [Acetobacteraceae bacterium]